MRPHLLLPLLLLPGCVTVSESNPTPPMVQRPRQPIAPAGSLAVSPLTRVGIDPSGDPTIFLHLEFRDSSQKIVKAFGRLHVELYMHNPGGLARAGATPGATTGAPPASQSLVQSWDDDLADPVRNALAFDEMITRTYKINLGGLPDPLIRWARREPPPAAAATADAEAPTLIVQFLPAAATTPDQTLRATHTLTR